MQAMSPPDWKGLSPQEPAPRDGYVARPDSVWERVLKRLDQGLAPIAIVGPSGAGKSTELVEVARMLTPHRLVAPCLQDHVQNPGVMAFQGEKLLGLAASMLIHRSQGASLGLSDSFLHRWVVPAQPGAFGALSPLFDSPADAMRELIAELKTMRGSQRPLVLLDGLERQDDAAIRSSLDAFRPFLTSLDLVVVLPARWTSDDAFSTVLDGYRIEALRPLAVRAEHGPSWREGRAFLTQIVCKRLGIAAAPDAAVSVLDRAAEASGGIPRVFLQLVQDAAFYASIAGREWPDADDLRQSMRDQVSSLRRLLRPGDLATLQSARGTDGLEVDVERRVRFLGHGLLLEYGEAEETRVFPTPLLEGLLALRAAA